MSKKVRAKFSCNSIEEFAFGSKTAKLTAIYGNEGENKDFTDSTPSGNLEINISGKVPAKDFFNAGKNYYLDFTEAE